MLDAIIERVGDWNPQLFRELKGQLKPRGLIIVGFLSFIGQLLIYLIFAGNISTDPDIYSPYVDEIDGVGVVNWTLWSADIFIILSFISFFGLLIIGTYLLTADLAKEARKGTLNFVRMSPQSAVSILVGKMLGVPALLYWGFAIAFPFHFAFGIAAGIPWYNLIGFDLIIVAACACFYSLAILIGLFPMQDAMGRSLPFGIAALVLMYLCFAQGAISHPFNSVDNFLVVFQPGLFLKVIAPEKSLFFMVQMEGEIFWFSPANFLTQNSSLVIFLGLANYALWTYWLWQGIKRRFHNNQNTLWSKIQSYRISASFVIVSLGFALASIPTSNDSRMEHIAGVQILYFFFCMVLTVCITPDREQVRIWALHRPQYRKGMASFIFDDKSPGVLAVGINGLILYAGVALYTVIAFVTRNPGDNSRFLFGTTIACLAISWAFILLITSVYQVLLLSKSRRGNVLAKSSLLAIVFLPPIGFSFLPMSSYFEPMLAWLFTPLVMFVVPEVTLIEIVLASIGYGLAIAATLGSMQRRTAYLGMSEAKILLNQNASTTIH